MNGLHFDMGNFCEKLKKLPEYDAVKQFTATPGEQYLYDIAVKSALDEQNLLYASIDFERFDEDDIVGFIDTCFPDFCNYLEKGEKIVQTIEKSGVLTADKQRFF